MTKHININNLTLIEKNGKTVIACDDELRLLMTGDLFLSKNIKANG